MKKTLWLITLVASMQTSYAKKPFTVACLGASITYGAGLPDREHTSYPAQLQHLLGGNYRVLNFGVSGATLCDEGDHPYMQTAAFKDALLAAPDMVVIDLGGNDAKRINRSHVAGLGADYNKLITAFKALPSRPRIVLLTAMTSFVADSDGIWDPVIVKQINPIIRQAAYDQHVEVIDMHSPFIDQGNHFPDHLHPDFAGAHIIATQVYQLIKQQRDSSFDIFSRLQMPVKISSYYGYSCADFVFAGRSCKIVAPKLAAKGHPWIWRARFWGHEPQTEIALLQQGFFVVYCDVAELLGNADAVQLWDDFYALLQHAGLARKAVLEGMSRGGIYVFNWAAKNPKKVSAVYVDNPLLNIPSWALHYPLNSKDGMYAAFRKDYQIDSLTQIQQFKQSPVDQVAEILSGHFPILVLCADADEAVDPVQNTYLFERKVKDLNGAITVIHKPGFKHHPHSLPNPKPIVDFLLRATGYQITLTE